MESSYRHRSVRANIALICSEWEVVRRKELGHRGGLVSPGETTEAAAGRKKEEVIPTPNPDFDYSLPFLTEELEENPDDSVPFPTPNPDFDYSLESLLSLAASGPRSEDNSNPRNSNPFPTPNPDFDYSLESLLPLTASVPRSEDNSNPPNSNPYPTPNPDFDYSLPSIP